VADKGKDITDQYTSAGLNLPTPSISGMTGTAAVKGAERTSYLGRLTEADAKSLVNRHFTVTRLTDMLVHEIANDIRFGYESVSEVIRHAVELLIEYYTENQMILAEHQGFANDIIRQQHEARLDAERAKIRQEFTDNIKVFDSELDVSRRLSDWSAVRRRLMKYRDMLENCESETQKRMLREILAESIATRSAVVAFYKWISSDYRVPIDSWSDDWPELADQWLSWYHDWGTT